MTIESILAYTMTVFYWLVANPEISVPVLVYLAYNIIPRIPPKHRFLFAIWSVGERFMLLSWEKWGGKAKALGIISPNPEEWADEQPTKKEGPK